MAFMILYLEGDQQFDANQISERLLDLPCVKPKPGFGDYSFRCEYRLDDGVVEIAIRDNGKSVALDTTASVAFAAALDVQEMCDAPVHLVDESYSFDLVVRDFPNADELHQAAAKAWG